MVCKSTTAIEVLISVSHLMLAINSSFNFVIYMFRGDRFRQIFWKIFVKRQWSRARRRSVQQNQFPMTRYLTFFLSAKKVLFLQTGHICSVVSRVSDSNYSNSIISNIFYYSNLDYFIQNNRIFRLFRFYAVP